MAAASGDCQAGLKWRQIAQYRGLLTPTTTESPPGERCGVSLAYLEALAASLNDLRQECTLPESTGDLLQHIILPALARPTEKSRSG